jgi:hypothetical protein
MFLAIFVVLGFAIGYWLEMSRAGYLVMALTSVGFFAGEIVHVLTTSNRAGLTVFPIVIGLILSTFMLIGALARVVARRYSIGVQ